jgi:hypothetical protein
MRNYPKASNLRIVSDNINTEKTFSGYMKKVVKAARQGKDRFSFSGYGEIASCYVDRFRSLGYTVDFSTEQRINRNNPGNVENHQRTITTVYW